MSRTRKFLSVITLLALMTLVIATPVLAYEGRGGDKVVVTGIVDDDLYVSAAEFVLEGTINGDLIVVAQSIIINGVVNGDLWAAGQAIQINGSVADDARIAGMALQVSSEAVIEDELLFAGASLETQAGSSVGGDVVLGAGQVLLAGDAGEDVLAGAGALELQGAIEGNVKAYVDQTAESETGPPPSTFMNFGPPLPFSMPTVPAGLTIDDNARIAGDLEYSSTLELSFPVGSVGGKTTRTEPTLDEGTTYVPPTPAEKTVKWALDSLRTMVTLILIGLLLGWLAPAFLTTTSGKLESQTWPSLGWGAIAWAAFFFALLLIVLVMVFGSMIFGLLTLGSLSGVIIWLGILALFALTVAFVLATAYVTKIVVGKALGKWIFSKANPSLAEHKFWPLVLGVVIIAIVVALFRFPLLPLGFLGWLLNFAVVLFGLGALWLWGRARFGKNPAG